MHTAELFKYIIDRPLPFIAKDNPVYLAPWKRPIQPSPLAFKGSLYILMDEASFSMNSFLLSVLKYNKIGIFVGAHSSGSYACSSASKDAVLRNTGLRVTYSTQVFTTAVENQEPGIGLEPDIRVDWTLEDYLAGRDPVMAAAMMMTVSVAAQDGFNWRSYAEVGGGISIASGGHLPLVALRSGPTGPRRCASPYCPRAR